MRTLLVCPELFRAEGGIARIMRLYLKALCASAAPGDAIDCLVLNDGPEPDPRLGCYAGPALATFTGCGGSRLRFAAQVIQLGRRADRAICGHLHLLPLVWLARGLGSDFEYSLVAHGIEVWRPYSLAERRALLGATHIFCVSDYTRRQMLRFCGDLEIARLVVLPNTLDPFLEPAPGMTRTSRPSGQPRLLAVSRLANSDAYKGIDTLIEALPLVRRYHPAAHLAIAGGGDDLPRLRALAAIQGVGDAVDFLGVLDDAALRAEYAACDVFALPSRREGFGLVFLEAMANGKACLGARAGGIPEVIDDRVGALAEYGNIPDIAAAVIDLVRHPRDPEAIRRHAGSFAFPTFQRQLAAALA